MALRRILPLALLPLVHAATVTYNFNATWLRANPDGLFERSVIGINGQFPIPPIEVNKGDTVVVNLNNQLGNESTSLHFHGLYMNGTTNMDGAVGVSQCPVAPGQSFLYNFTVDQPGTYWYHSHVNSQYPDGLRGPFIVHDSENPYKDQIYEERVLTISDWYHERIPVLMKQFVNVANPTGAEPVPDSALMNDTQNLTTMVEPGKTYMFRIINVGAFAAQYFWFENHTMSIIEVDGVYTEPAEADTIYITAAQRYSVLVTMKNDTSANFAFTGSMDQELFDVVPPALNPNVTGWLVYNGKTDDHPPAALIDEFEPFDDFKLVPQDGEPLLPEPDHTVNLDMKMDNLKDGANYAFFNDVSYVTPKVPTIFTALTTGNLANDSRVYGENTNAFILQKGQTIDLVLNNRDPGKHPFHLHGHNFQTIVRSAEDAGDYVHNETFPTKPMRRDTLLVRPNGNFVIRFRADNPEWHLATGLVATMIEAPLDLQSSNLQTPSINLAACASSKTLTAGNAAGNTQNLLDLTGANKPPGPLPAGFTTRGVVALVFSCLCGILGVGVVTWYGLGEIENQSGTNGKIGGVGTFGKGAVTGAGDETKYPDENDNGSAIDAVTAGSGSGNHQSSNNNGNGTATVSS